MGGRGVQATETVLGNWDIQISVNKFRWSEAKIRMNTLDRYNQSTTQLSKYDSLSIMQYPRPATYRGRLPSAWTSRSPKQIRATRAVSASPPQPCSSGFRRHQRHRRHRRHLYCDICSSLSIFTLVQHLRVSISVATLEIAFRICPVWKIDTLSTNYHRALIINRNFRKHA